MALRNMGRAAGNAARRVGEWLFGRRQQADNRSTFRLRTGNTPRGQYNETRRGLTLNRRQSRGFRANVVDGSVSRGV